MSSLIITLEESTRVPAAVWRVAGAVGVLLLGLLLARMIAGTVEHFVSQRDGGGKTLAPALGKFVRIALSLLAVMAGLDQIGIDTSGILAGLAAAGLAIALALKDTMSDLAAGVVLLIRRPFDAGEAVDLGGQAGIVSEIDLFETRLVTFEGVPLTLPNSKVRAGAILNYSRATTRRTDLKVRVPLTASLDEAKRVVSECLRADERVLSEPDILVNVDAVGESEVTLLARYHCVAADFLDLKMDMIASFKTALDAAGMHVPKAQRELHIVEDARGKAS